jgi:mannose-6-phosphate isomerase-like protein (cupin superfamily)
LQDFYRRPWGEFHILADMPYTKVKRLIINPGHRLSLQSHKMREEHWVVVRGVATVSVGEQTKELSYGQYIFVPRGAKHRIACAGNDPVEIIEVQTGEAFPEEDIVRFEDDYKRV